MVSPAAHGSQSVEEQLVALCMPSMACQDQGTLHIGKLMTHHTAQVEAFPRSFDRSCSCFAAIHLPGPAPEAAMHSGLADQVRKHQRTSHLRRAKTVFCRATDGRRGVSESWVVVMTNQTVRSVLIVAG